MRSNYRRLLIGCLFSVILPWGLVASRAAAQTPNPIQAAKDAWKKAKEQQKQGKNGQPAPGQPTEAAQPGSSPQARGGAPVNGSSPFTPPPGTKIEEKMLAPVQPRAVFYLSPHGVHVALVGTSGSRATVIYDGEEGPKFDEILMQDTNNHVVFSPDGNRYAYCARSGTEFVVMVDGKELTRSSESNQGQFSGLSCTLGFTSNSKHVYYHSYVSKSSMTGDSFIRFVFDGKSGVPTAYEGGNRIPIAFSPDGDHFAHIWNDPAKQRPWTLIVDGKSAGYQGGVPQWSADSKHLFTQINFTVPREHRGGTDLLLDGKPIMRAQGVRLFVPPAGDMTVAIVNAPAPSHGLFLVVAGKKVPGSELENGGIDEIVFSPDGKRYAAKYRNINNKQYVFADGKRGLEYQFIDKIAFTPDSTQVTYLAIINSKNFQVVGEKESDGYMNLVEPVIAPVGNRVAGMVSNSNDGAWLLLDAKATRVNARAIGAFSFSPEGSHYAYVAYDNGMGRHLALDGVIQPSSNLGLSNAPVDGKFVFSPDGKHIAHFALPPSPTGGYQGLFLDGKFIPLGQSSNLSQLTFTPDGRHLFWVEDYSEGIRVFMDGQLVAQGARASIPPIAGWWEVSSDGMLSLLVQKEDSLKRISIMPPPDTSIATLLGGRADVEANRKK